MKLDFVELNHRWRSGPTVPAHSRAADSPIASITPMTFVIEKLTRMENFFSRRSKGCRSVLIIANDLIPTVQLSFLKPLTAAVEANELSIKFWSEKDIRTMSKLGAVALRLKTLAPDIVVFSRYSGIMAREILASCVSSKVPTVYHIDDDLLNVPRSFGEKKYLFHNDPARLGAVRHLLENADLVYAANARLAKHLGNLARIRAIEAGSIYCASDIYRNPNVRPTFRIGYMGFDHAEDFAVATPALDAIMQRFPEVTFAMFGPVPIPATLARFGERIRVIDPVRDYESFRLRLAEEEWDVGLCPLVRSEFNLLKSDTKWVEYTASGMATVASADTIYDACCADGCGVLAGAAPDDWEGAIAALVQNSDLRLAIAKKAQAKVAEAYSVVALARQIMEVFDLAAVLAAKRTV